MGHIKSFIVAWLTLFSIALTVNTVATTARGDAGIATDSSHGPARSYGTHDDGVVLGDGILLSDYIMIGDGVVPGDRFLVCNNLLLEGDVQGSGGVLRDGVVLGDGVVLAMA